MDRPMNFDDLRQYLAHRVDSPAEREASLARAAANCAATVAILERTEARRGLVEQLGKVS